MKRTCSATARTRLRGAIAATAVLALGATSAQPIGALQASAQGSSKSITVLEAAGQNGSWTGFDPTATTSPSQFTGDVLGRLFDVGIHNTLVPDLATGYELSPDGLNLTLTLRRGVTFSNGDPFNASVVAYSLKRDIDPHTVNGITNSLNWPMSSVSTPNTRTVVVHFSRVLAAVVSELNQPPFATPVDPIALSKMGEVAYNLAPVGAGPYMVESDKTSTSLTLVRNPHYWKSGVPKLDSIHVETVASDENAYAALQAGQAQIYESLGTINLVNTIKKNSKFSIYKVPPNSPFIVKLNTKVPPFNNITAREALYYATDPRSIDQKLFDSQYPLTQSPTGPAGLFYQPTVPGYRTYNLAKARALVKQLGGLNFNLTDFDLPFVIQTAEALESQWHQAGITATLSSVDLTRYIQTFQSGDWTAFMTIAGSYDPSIGNLSVSSGFSSQSPFSGVHDPKLTGMLEQASATLNMAKRAAQYKAIFKYLSDEAYGVFLFNFATFNVYAKNVVGATGPAGVGGVASVINWANVSLK